LLLASCSLNKTILETRNGTMRDTNVSLILLCGIPPSYYYQFISKILLTLKSDALMYIAFYLFGKDAPINSSLVKR